MVHQQNGEVTKIQLKELDDLTDHTLSLEIKEMGMKIKFDLSTKKAMMFQMDNDAKKYIEITQAAGVIVSFK